MPAPFRFYKCSQHVLSLGERIIKNLFNSCRVFLYLLLTMYLEAVNFDALLYKDISPQ